MPTLLHLHYSIEQPFLQTACDQRLLSLYLLLGFRNSQLEFMPAFGRFDDVRDPDVRDNVWAIVDATVAGTLEEFIVVPLHHNSALHQLPQHFS